MLKTILPAFIAFSVAMAVSPANAFVDQVATSIPTAGVDNDAQLQEALYAAIKDVLTQAIVFRPSLVQLQRAKLVGDRIYLLLLMADPDGEEMLRRFEGAPTD